MALNPKAFKKLLNGLTMLYIHIGAKPKQPYFSDVLLFFNMALLNRDKIGGNTLKSLDTGIKSISEECYISYRGWMNRYCQENVGYDAKAAMSHINVLLAANDRIIEKLQNNEYKEAGAMAASIVNYPDFILGRYEKDSKEFFEDELCAYNRDFNDSFLEGFDQWFVPHV